MARRAPHRFELGNSRIERLPAAGVRALAHECVPGIREPRDLEHRDAFVHVPEKRRVPLPRHTRPLPTRPRSMYAAPSKGVASPAVAEALQPLNSHSAQP
jgi:hypothetical protein